MRQLFRIWGVFSVAALALIGCNGDIDLGEIDSNNVMSPPSSSSSSSSGTVVHSMDPNIIFVFSNFGSLRQDWLPVEEAPGRLLLSPGTAAFDGLEYLSNFRLISTGSMLGFASPANGGDPHKFFERGSTFNIELADKFGKNLPIRHLFIGTGNEASILTLDGKNNWPSPVVSPVAVRALLEERAARASLDQCQLPLISNDDVGFSHVAEQHNELIVAAIKCGLTKVVTFELGGRDLDWEMDLPELKGLVVHQACPHAGPDHTGALVAAVNNSISTVIAGLMKRLLAEDNGRGGTLMDNTLIYMTSLEGDCDAHSRRNSPAFLAVGRDLTAFRRGTAGFSHGGEDANTQDFLSAIAQGLRFKADETHLPLNLDRAGLLNNDE